MTSDSHHSRQHDRCGLAFHPGRSQQSIGLCGLHRSQAGTIAVASLTSGALDEIDLRDPIGYLAVAVPLIAVVLVATYIPARRATHVDPMLALRAE